MNHSYQVISQYPGALLKIKKWNTFLQRQIGQYWHSAAKKKKKKKDWGIKWFKKKNLFRSIKADQFIDGRASSHYLQTGPHDIPRAVIKITHLAYSLQFKCSSRLPWQFSQRRIFFFLPWENSADNITLRSLRWRSCSLLRKGVATPTGRQVMLPKIVHYKEEALCVHWTGHRKYF